MIQGLIEIANANVALVNLVGMNKAGTKPKIYWVIAGQQEVTPYIIFALAGTQPNQVKDVTSTLEQDTVNAFVYSENPEEADEIERALRNAIELSDTSTSTVYFHRIYKIGGNDGYDKDALKPYRVSVYSVMSQR